MDKNQKINCNVGSCKFNDTRKCECNLDQITVEPAANYNTKLPDESLCGSYEYRKENK